MMTKKLRRCSTTGSSPVEASASMLEEEKPRKKSSKKSKSKSKSKKSSRSPSRGKKKTPETAAVFEMSLVVEQDSSQQVLNESLNNSWGSISIESVLTDQDDDDAAVDSVNCRTGRTHSSRRRNSISSRRRSSISSSISSRHSRSRSPLATFSVRDKSGRSTQSSASGSGKSISFASLLGDDLFQDSSEKDDVDWEHSWGTAEFKRRTSSATALETVSPKSIQSSIQDSSSMLDDSSWGELHVDECLASSSKSQKAPSKIKRAARRTKSSSSTSKSGGPQLPGNPPRTILPPRTVSMGSARMQQHTSSKMSSSSRTGIRTRIPRGSSSSSSALLDQTTSSSSCVRSSRRRSSKTTSTKSTAPMDDISGLSFSSSAIRTHRLSSSKESP